MLTVGYRNAMSALPPKADICGALADVCYGPKADIEGNYSITSSAATSSPAGIFKPIAAAAVYTAALFISANGGSASRGV